MDKNREHEMDNDIMICRYTYKVKKSRGLAKTSTTLRSI